MYRLAYKHNDEVIFYFDTEGNKYVASGGSLGWRINNPGLVRSHSHFSRRNGSIGACGIYAIFSNPQQGRKALSEWLHSKKYYHSNLWTLGEHYQPSDPEAFINKIALLTGITADAKIDSLSHLKLNLLIRAIEKYCGYCLTGDESFSLLPKITAKIENAKGQEAYLIGDTIVLSKKEAIDWILSHRLDGVIVHNSQGDVHLRSRPNHCIWNIRMHEAILPPSQGQIDTLIRQVGEWKQGQCIWGFINGVSNTKDEALVSAGRISEFANGEMVCTMPNDSAFLGLKDGLACITLKLNIDTPIVQWTAKFFRYLLQQSEQSNHAPVILFVHSQGAIISEHALELLKPSEREKIRIFTFGGGSFISPEKSHPDSHNYASAADLVCSLGSPNLRFLALQVYIGNKEGIGQNEVISQLALQDAMLDLDSIDIKIIDSYTKKRLKHYETELSKISNLTILDPDPDKTWKHEFKSDCYQKTVQSLVERYQSCKN